MDFIKKHYEKVLLGVVLLGLVVGVAFLFLIIASERQNLEDKSKMILTQQTKALQPLPLARAKELIKRAEASLSLDLSTTNRLLNPLRWQRTPDGRMVAIPPGDELKLLKVTTNRPLYTTITLDSLSVQTNGAVRYVIGIIRDASANPVQRRKSQAGALLKEKKEKDGFGFTIVEVKGTPESPTELVLELSDTGERATLDRDADKPAGALTYRREDGYMADLASDLDKGKKWTNRREGDHILFGGEDYIIVAIRKNEVVLSAKSNNKRTSVPYNPGL